VTRRELELLRVQKSATTLADGDEHRVVALDARAPQSLYDRGYAVSRAQAMADFKVRWGV
jgi:hypothetical protein